MSWPALKKTSKRATDEEVRQFLSVERQDFRYLVPEEATGTLFFGLDGDDTGVVLERLFVSAKAEDSFMSLSTSVSGAIASICDEIRAKLLCGAIIFAAGDDILFKGVMDEVFLRRLQQLYHQQTNGLTCSIGFGRTFREVYLALKLAKASPGKHCIVGIEVFSEHLAAGP